MSDLIERDAAIEALGECPYNWNDDPEEIQAVNDWEDMRTKLEKLPAVDAVPAEAYDHLLHLAKTMHLWIFLNAIDEQEVYDELGFTDDDNALLGSIGRPIIIKDGEAE